MKIEKVSLPVANLAQTEEFYLNNLGMEPAYRDVHRIAFFAGSSVLEFYLMPEAAGGQHLAFNIPPGSAETMLEKLGDRIGVIPVEEHTIIADFRAWKAKAFYFKDPEGNLLEYIARDELPKALWSEGDTPGILHISETGLVVPDPLLVASSLQRSLGLPFFSRQAPSDTFTVMGDDEGLLILVPPGRPWFPTGEPSRALPFSVWLEEGHKKMFLDRSILSDLCP